MRPRIYFERWTAEQRDVADKIADVLEEVVICDYCGRRVSFNETEQLGDYPYCRDFEACRSERIRRSAFPADRTGAQKLGS